MIDRVFGYALFALVVVSQAFAIPAFAGDVEGPYQKSLFGVAADGYDVVSYFSEGKAVEGKSDLTFQWKDVKWRFSNAENLETFKGDPEKYAPQYGGYCAYAVAQGSTASIDPEAWSIVDGKLYLNYSKSVQSRWADDMSRYIEAGDKNWPEIRKSL